MEAAAGHDPAAAVHPRSSVNSVWFVVGLPPGPNVTSVVLETGYFP